MSRYTLQIKTENEILYNKYSNNQSSHNGDSGIDLYTPCEIAFLPGETKLINLNIKCQMIDNMTGEDVSYYLYPRSSMGTKTPLRMANSIGVIDAGYRGEIMAAFTYIPTNSIFKEINETGKIDFEANKFIIPAGTRIVQICSSDLSQIKYKLCDQLTVTERGEGGFGSTGETI
jgi:dUTP pyrophosphatase